MHHAGCTRTLHVIPWKPDLQKEVIESSVLYRFKPLVCSGVDRGRHAFFLQVLQELLEQGSHPSLTPKVCETLLQDVPSTGVKTVQEEGGGEQEDKAGCDPSTGLVVLMGYPDYPLYKRLADSLAYWMVTG